MNTSLERMKRKASGDTAAWEGATMRRSWVFAIWAVILSAVWVLLNLPWGPGLKPFLPREAGFPWAFAVGTSDTPTEVSIASLAADIGVGLAIIVTIAGIIAWNRSPRQK